MARTKQTARRSTGGKAPRKSHAHRAAVVSQIPRKPDYDRWLVKDLKELLLSRDINLKTIKGSGKNGNVIKADLVREAELL